MMNRDSAAGPTAPAPRHLSAPRTMEVSITGRCNLECRYCFYADEMAALSDLPAADWELAFSKMGAARVLSVVLTGGEVFTRSDIFRLIDSVVENRMRYGILTNGTLVEEATAEELSRGLRRVRLDSVQVSIDGSCPDIHDRARPGSFEGAVRGLELLLRAGLPATARVTLSRHNIDDLENIALFLLEDMGLPAFSVCDASPIGAGCDRGTEISLDHADTLRAGLRLEELAARYPGRITASAGPLARLRIYRQMERELASGGADGGAGGFLSACGGVFSSMAVLHDGTLVPCSMLHDIRLGSILTDDLTEVWHGSPGLKALRGRYSTPLSSIPGCSGCRWTEYCRGGCPGIARQLQGTLLEPDRRICYRDFLKVNGIERVPGPVQE